MAGRYAGWQDPALTSRGVAEAERAARSLRSAGVGIDSVHTSVLRRARSSAQIVVDGLGLSQDQIKTSWRLNERHGGALQGLTRDEMTERYGREAVRAWKRQADRRPPQLSASDLRHPRRDPRYADVAPEQLPGGESSVDVLVRVRPYWRSVLRPDLEAGHGVLVVAHQHLLRALRSYLDGRGRIDDTGPEVANGEPWILWLDPEEREVVGRS